MDKLSINTKPDRQQIDEINTKTYRKITITAVGISLCRLSTYTETLVLDTNHHNFNKLSCKYLIIHKSQIYWIDYSKTICIDGSCTIMYKAINNHAKHNLLFTIADNQLDIFDRLPNLLGCRQNGSLILNDKHPAIDLLCNIIKKHPTIDGKKLVKEYNSIRFAKTKSAANNFLFEYNDYENI